MREKILDGGSFRIGTLYDYRKTEAHGAEVGDPREGKVGARSQVLSWSSSDPKLRDDHAAQFVRGGNSVVFTEGSSISFGAGGSISFGTNGVSLRNVALRLELQVQDLYVFSFSAEPSAELMRRMGYDACYEISDVDKFLTLLATSLSAKLVGWSAVLYRSKEMHYNEARSINPALIKEPPFAYQKECRALWQPSAPTILPQIVGAPEAAKLCSIMDLEAQAVLDPSNALCNP
ncbi:MAG TPA: hypothetical protein VM915_03220 [Verrucomicrobiae bacterium]|nr:hypothetical protein [Verrucomicrobiae bacterium]